MGCDAQGNMTRQRLKQYRALEREIRMLEERLRSVAPVSGGVRGVDVRSPNAEHAITVTGVDQAALNRLEHRRIQARAERSTIERFIDGIEDSLTRTVLEERYIRGSAWAQVAMVAGGANTRESVRQIAYRFLQK